MDADTGTAAVSAQYQITNRQELIFVRVENNREPSCYATETLLLKKSKLPVVSNISDLNLCATSPNSEYAIFNLQQKNAEILNSQAVPSDFLVSYYLNRSDALADRDPIVSQIQNSTNPQTVFYKITATDNPLCHEIGSFDIEVSALPEVRISNAFYKCDLLNDSKENFDFTDYNSEFLTTLDPAKFSVSYFLSSADAQNDIRAISGQYECTATVQEIFARVQNIDNSSCYSVSVFNIGISTMPIANKPKDLVECEDPLLLNTASFNFNEQDSQILAGQDVLNYSISYHADQYVAGQGTDPIASDFRNTSNPQTIFARIQSRNNPSCYALTSFKLYVREIPKLEMPEEYIICNQDEVMIYADSGYEEYEWSGGEKTRNVTIRESGNYWVKVSKNHGDITCETIREISVKKSLPIEISDIKVKEWTADNNSIFIVVDGSAQYTYSIDGVHYQNSPAFTGLQSGGYTVYVKDENGCELPNRQVYLLAYPKFFTPNGDGYNERWNIKFSEFEPDMKITIFDRYGKLISSFKGGAMGWDGTLNGKQLPSSDYWFTIERKEKEVKRGHFSLKR